MSSSAPWRQPTDDVALTGASIPDHQDSDGEAVGEPDRDALLIAHDGGRQAAPFHGWPADGEDERDVSATSEHTKRSASAAGLDTDGEGFQKQREDQEYEGRAEGDGVVAEEQGMTAADDDGDDGSGDNVASKSRLVVQTSNDNSAEDLPYMPSDEDAQPISQRLRIIHVRRQKYHPVEVSERRAKSSTVVPAAKGRGRRTLGTKTSRREPVRGEKREVPCTACMHADDEADPCCDQAAGNACFQCARGKKTCREGE